MESQMFLVIATTDGEICCNTEKQTDFGIDRKCRIKILFKAVILPYHFLLKFDKLSFLIVAIIVWKTWPHIPGLWSAIIFRSGMGKRTLL